MPRRQSLEIHCSGPNPQAGKLLSFHPDAAVVLDRPATWLAHLLHVPATWTAGRSSSSTSRADSFQPARLPSPPATGQATEIGGRSARCKQFATSGSSEAA